MSTSSLKRLLSLVLVLVLVVSMVPFPTYAMEETQTDNAQEIIVSDSEPTEESQAEQNPTCNANGHTVVESEEEPALCEEPGLTAGTYCSVCNVTLSGREVIPANGHFIESVEAKQPTFGSVGWEAYERCLYCGYSTYVEIPALEVPAIEDYDTFLLHLSVLEEVARVYVMENPDKDPLELIIKYIRTGVDRYNSGSWGIMAGYEDPDFAKFVTEMEDFINSEASSPEEMIAICSLKNLGTITLPNGEATDIGHMFGTMDITYHNNFGTNHADVGGWSGDLVDLLEFSDIMEVSGSLEEMVTKIGADLLLKTPPVPSSPSFSQTDMYGDLDALYFMTTLKKTGYEPGALVPMMMEYFTEDLSMEDRAEFFLKNRLDGVSTRNAVRDAVYNAYTTNKVIATLEGTREFSSNDLATLRKAVCYAYADYICKLAGDYVEPADTSYYDVFSSTYDVLAPGITQEIKQATTTDGKQIVYYVATADITRDDVEVYANYNDNDPAKGWEMQRVLDQANAAQNRHSNPDDPENYIPNYNVVVSTNGAGFDMSTGEPGGLLVMGGVEYHPINSNGFFGILKDGTPVIGTTEEYNTIYKGQVRDGIAGFGATLIEDGKIVATGNTNRHSRTAVGITKTGKVVLMVLDGRQEPFSAGGDMGEIAQIMLEAGCWHAINLDGGGSTTFVAKQPGEEELEVINKPSDGFQRSVATSLMIVSTAPSSTAFDHALLESETDYLTVGTSLQLTAKGISATGNEAELPEITGWTVSDEALATITNDGVFTALRNGDVEVYLMSGETVIGTKTMHIVTPNKVYFTKTNLDTVFGATTALPVKVLYDGKPVTVNENDLVFSLSNSKAGKVEGFNFVATSNENTTIKNVVITAALKADSSVAGTITVALYKQGEMTFDFDQATGGDRMLAWYREVTNATQEDANTYVVVDPAKQILTNYTLAIDMTQIPIPAQLEDLTYMLPGSDVEGANAWTFLMQLAQRISVLSTITATVRFDPSLDVDISNMKLVNQFFTLTDTKIDAETNTVTMILNWKKQTAAIDPNTANPLCIVSGIKLTPKADANWGSKNRLDIANVGSIGYKIYMRASALYSFAQKPENQKTFGLYAYVNPDDAEDKGGYFQDTYKTFEDTYTLINALKKGWYMEDGGFAYYVEGEKLTGVQKVDGLYYDFGENGINVGQTTYTGLYFDADANVYRYCKLGVFSTGWVQINSNWHYFKNYLAATGRVNVGGVYYDFEETGKLVSGKWVNTLNGVRYYYGPNYYWNGWREIDGALYHFKNGYRLTGYHCLGEPSTSGIKKWYNFGEDGIAVPIMNEVYTDSDGKIYNIVDGKTRIGLFKIGEDYYFFNKGGTVATGRFYVWESQCEYPCDTYYFDDEGKMIVNGLATIDGVRYYFQNGKAKQAGLVEIDGYYYFVGDYGKIATGKAYVWKGNGIVPENHYTFAEDGKMLGVRVENGQHIYGQVVEMDGKLYYYNMGRPTQAGVTEVDGYYYFAGDYGEIATGRFYVWKGNGIVADGHYTFGADGKMLGVQVVNGVQTLGQIVEQNGELFYYENGKATKAGLIEHNGYYYFAGDYGEIATGKAYVWKTNGIVPENHYTFAEDGKMLGVRVENGQHIYGQVVEMDGKLYYYNMGRPTQAGVTEVDGYYYFAGDYGEIATGRFYVWKTNGIVTENYYTFAEDGRMLGIRIENGETILGEIVERDGAKYVYSAGAAKTVGLVEIDGYYYFVGDNGLVATGKTYVWKTNGILPENHYTFDAEGRMLGVKIVDGVQVNGDIVEIDGALYYYECGRGVAAGLIYRDGYYYFASDYGKLIVNQKYYVWKTNDLLLETQYYFNELGQIVK